jgi:large subunit ribosomal protein L37e
MTKGTPSLGRHNKVVHIRCRRCGEHSFHKVKKRCSHCGYPDSKIRNFRWQWKNPLTKGRKK